MDFQCSKCGKLVTDKQWEYCPRCGFKLYMFNLKTDTEMWKEIVNIIDFLKYKFEYNRLEQYGS